MSRRFVVFEDPVLATPAGKLGPSASALSSRLQALRDVTNTKQQKNKGEAEKGAPSKEPLFLTVRQVRLPADGLSRKQGRRARVHGHAPPLPLVKVYMCGCRWRSKKSRRAQRVSPIIRTQPASVTSQSRG
jgi:hypothetical protein